ncbi:hypothetical protein OYC64_001047 [Pagothenia borchgrevinki]|uniref:Uncharacterized protein n=1 Tax=Pagothenia borchgrevinki TaxID=8213 RepID=A0ABD2HEL8_PAGBO
MSDLKDEEEDKSPAPSCLSLKRDRSIGDPLNFRDEPGPSDTKQRAGSPAPSCLSLKSDWSRVQPLNFRDEPGPSDTNVTGLSLRLEKMSDLKDEEDDKSPAPSCLSLKRDRSRGDPPDFREEPGPSVTEQRAGSPAPSCLSLKSDWSRMQPLNFSDEPGPSDTK